MEECLSIAGNKNAWAESNNEEILDSAVLKYVEKLLWYVEQRLWENDCCPSSLS